MGKGAKNDLISSAPPGLTDEEIDLAFQQSGTSTDEPQSPGPSSQLVPAQPAHPVVYSK